MFINPINNTLYKIKTITFDDKGIINNLDLERIPSENIENYNTFVTYSFIDLHTHTRIPGDNQETPKSIQESALHGGYDTLVAMANTHPPVDNPQILNFVLEQFKSLDIDIKQLSAISSGLKGEQKINFDKMSSYGAFGFSEDGKWVYNTQIMLDVLNYAKINNKTIFTHNEDVFLAQNKTIINDGEISKKFGLDGIKNIAESTAVLRDCYLSYLTGAKIHLQHISTKESIEIIKYFKKIGANITAETAPHYFSLTEFDIKTADNGYYKVNPPLRTQDDKIGIIKALKDGTIDTIATDHAPHLDSEKNISFKNAKPGFVGLDLAFSIGLTYLYDKKYLNLFDLVRKFNEKPAQIINKQLPKLEVGNKVNLTFFNTKEEWEVKKEEIKSNCKNTPFLGKKLKGKVKGIFINGKYFGNF